MTLEQVREQLGVGNYSAVAMQISRLQRQLPQIRNYENNSALSPDA